jgi:type I restriction enzyme S subunit
MSSKQSTNLASINSKQLKAYPIGLPGIAEQAAIAQSVDHVKTVLDKLATEARNFQARKLGLMQDLLTGKVTVDSPDNVAAHA